MSFEVQWGVTWIDDPNKAFNAVHEHDSWEAAARALNVYGDKAYVVRRTSLTTPWIRVGQSSAEEARNELTRVVYLALTSVDFAGSPFASDAAANRQANAVVDALLSGKSSKQLGSEATNGQEGNADV